MYRLICVYVLLTFLLIGLHSPYVETVCPFLPVVILIRVKVSFFFVTVHLLMPVSESELSISAKDNASFLSCISGGKKPAFLSK